MYQRKNFSALLKQYERLLWKEAMRGFTPELIEAAYNEAIIGLYEASQRFNAKRGIPFIGYAQSHIRNKINTLFRQYTKDVSPVQSLDANKKNDNNSLSLHETIRDTSFSEDAIIHNLDLKHALQTLSPTEQSIVYDYFFRGLTQKEIAIKYAVSQQAIAHRKKVILQKLQRILAYDQLPS